MAAETKQSEQGQGPNVENDDGRDSMESVPDLLAHALIVPDPGVAEEPTPTSVVDDWAFSDDEHRLDDDELQDRISSMPALGEDAEAPSVTTLRPSAVTLRPKQIQRQSREPWLLAVAAVLAIGAGAWLTTTHADSPAPPVVAAASDDPAQAERAEPEAKPAAVDSQQGVSLRTATEGVMAIVEGKAWGPLPVSLSHLSPGTHRIRFEAPGFHTLDRDVVVREGQMVDLDVALDPKPVQVVLEVEPPNAFMLVSDSGNNVGEGRRLPGPWPRIIELEPGTYTFVAFRAGFGNVQRTVEIEPGPDASAVRFELSKIDVYE